MNRVGPIVLLVLTILVLTEMTPTQEKSLKSELKSRAQKEGLVLVQFERGSIGAISFSPAGDPRLGRKLLDDTVHAEEGVISPDGAVVAFIWSYDDAWKRKSRLGTVNSDGTNLHEYPEIRNPGSMCWSHDHSKLVTTTESGLVIFDIAARSTQEISRRGSPTPQCWSPDDKQIVYSIYDKETDRSNVVVCDVDKKTSRELIQGESPTWSPDGNVIAFADGKAFYLVSPAGGARRRLLRKHKELLTPLYWVLVARLAARGLCGLLLLLAVRSLQRHGEVSRQAAH